MFFVFAVLDQKEPTVLNINEGAIQSVCNASQQVLGYLKENSQLELATVYANRSLAVCSQNQSAANMGLKIDEQVVKLILCLPIFRVYEYSILILIDFLIFVYMYTPCIKRRW